MSINTTATGGQSGQLSDDQIIAQLPPEMQEKYKQWKRTQSEVPPTRDTEAAEEKAEREKGYFTQQAISKRRVAQSKDGSWHPLIDRELNQEQTAYSGAIYDTSKAQYMLTSIEGEWIRATETAVKNYLSHDREIKDKKDQEASMNYITRTANVEFATPLAGYSKGIYSFDGRRVLVTNSPNIIRPVKGDWRTIETLHKQMFGDYQLIFLYGWLKVAVTALISGDFQSGQVVVLIGPADCGKSFLQNKIITPLLGGREAKPYQYMTAQTSFNSDLFKAEHLIIADETPATEYSERCAFGAGIKNMVAEPMQRLHAKGRDAMMLEPFWRVTMSLNDEPENLMVLPPYNESMKDKLILFKVDRAQCLPNGERDSRARFAEAIRNELPAFMHFLLHEYQIPEEFRKGRFGIQEYCNPEISLAIDDISPEAALMSMIHQELFKETGQREEWEGTSEELAAMLKGDGSTVKGDAQKLFSNSTRLGRMLTNLAKNTGNYQGAVTVRKKDGRSRYRLFRHYRGTDDGE